MKSCNIIVTATGPQALELCFLNSFIDYKLDAFHICYLVLIKICPKAILNSFGVAGVLSSWGGEHLQLILMIGNTNSESQVHEIISSVLQKVVLNDY